MEQVVLKTKIFIAGTLSPFIRGLNYFLSLFLIPHAIKNVYTLYKYNKECGGNAAVVLLCQHIGDIVTCEPVSTYLKKEKGKKVVWIVRKSFKEILTLFRDVDLIMEVDCVSECVYMSFFMHSFEVHNLHLSPRECHKYHLNLYNPNTTYTMENYFNFGSILETFSTVGNLPALKMKPHLELSSEDRFPELDLPFVAIHVIANEVKRQWPFEKWEKLIRSYPNITFVEVGLTPHFRELSNVISEYCGKLSLVDIAYMINKCSAFLGIESSIAHYSNALSRPSLVLLGQYNFFDYYVPYSEWDTNFFMIHHNGTVCELPLDRVLKEFNEKLLPYLLTN